MERFWRCEAAAERASFSELEHDSKKRRMRRELFLEKMSELVPRQRLEERIEPFYPKARRGRRPCPLSAMLWVHGVRLFYNLRRPGMEDLLCEVESVRRFVGLRLSGPLPDEATILNFRHLLERHGLGEALFAEINAYLSFARAPVEDGDERGRENRHRPSSTMNSKGERGTEMRQTTEGNRWYFGMKAHIGVDADSGLAHSLETTPTNVTDVATAHALLHGGEDRVWDAAVDSRVALKPGRRRRLDKAGAQEAVERGKASVRAKVEHPFLYLKRHFGYAKVRYRGLAKNTQRIALLLGFSNLLIAGRYATA